MVSCVNAPESRSFVSSSPCMLVHRQPSRIGRKTPPSAWIFSLASLTIPQYKRSPTKVIQRIEPSSSKKYFNSLAERLGVPLTLPSSMKDSRRSRHRPDWHSSNLSGFSAPKPIRIMPLSKHSFSHLPLLPSLMYRTRVGLIGMTARVRLLMDAASSKISTSGQSGPLRLGAARGSNQHQRHIVLGLRPRP